MQAGAFFPNICLNKTIDILVTNLNVCTSKDSSSSTLTPCDVVIITFGPQKELHSLSKLTRERPGSAVDSNAGSGGGARKHFIGTVILVDALNVCRGPRNWWGRINRPIG